MKTQRRIILPLFILVIISAASFLFSPAGTGYASSPATVTVERPVVPEGDDFATRVLGQPWNMNVGPYPDYHTALKNIDRNQFSMLGIGDWRMVSVNTDPRLWLHWPGVGTTQTVLRMGDSRPIDASKYKLLSYYMCLNTAPSQVMGEDEDWASLVYWMYDRSPNQDPGNGFSKFAFFKQQKLFTNSGDCALMTFDLSKSATWQTGTWDNNPRQVMGLRLDPINKAGKSFDIGWVRLTTIDPSNIVPITWSNAPAGEVQFYLTRKACGAEGILVGRHPNPTGSGTFNWGAELQPGFSASHPLPIPESFEPGTYQVYLKDAGGQIACSATPLSVHAAPILDFQSPSPYSGPDFATTIVKDPWGMSNGADITSSAQVNNLKFLNGILSAVATGTDSRLNLNVPGTIDTSIYRFATFRMKVDGQNGEDNAWVQRFIWWWNGPSVDNATTQDLMLYEGWHTYTIDLETARMETCTKSDCWSGLPTGFRFDPFEAIAGTSFQLDFVTLTGFNTLTHGEGLKVYYTLPNAPGAQVTMFLDVDKNPDNGRIAAPQMPENPLPLDGPEAVFKAFMPIVSRPDLSSSEIVFFNGSSLFVIDTGGLTPGTYYISADVNDGTMNTTWYSETPVIIK